VLRLSKHRAAVLVIIIIIILVVLGFFGVWTFQSKISTANPSLL